MPIGPAAYPARHMSMESIYEYGARAGVWRILREFERRSLPLTVFGVSMALERHPEATAAFVEHGGFLYDADSYGDDLPFWTEVETGDAAKAPHLVVPYTLDCNDMRLATAQGFNTSEQFLAYLRDAFDVLYAEGAERPRMMSVGMHCQLLGRPGRFAALQRFLDHIEHHDRVWVSRRVDIAQHWVQRHPFGDAKALASSRPAPRESRARVR